MSASAHVRRSAAVILAAMLASPVSAQRTIDVGKREFEANCAACHGADARGDGPLKPFLTRTPPDLTLLAKENDGVMPVSRIYAFIEGTERMENHGPADMPIWGREYRAQTGKYHFEMPFEPESLMRARVLSVIDYIHRLQRTDG